MNKFIFDNTLIQQLKDYLDETYEICGNLFHSKDSKFLLRLHDINEGSTINKRRLCTYTRYTNFILHTHPNEAYSYPSYEDINKVSKHTIINNSIIACYWGIWQIYRINKDIIDYNQDVFIKQCINHLGSRTSTKFKDRITFNSKHPINENYKSLPFDENILEQVRKFISKLNHYLPNIQIRFDSWEDVEYLYDNKFILIQ